MSCEHVNKKGKKCTWDVMKGSKFCGLHEECLKNKKIKATVRQLPAKILVPGPRKASVKGKSAVKIMPKIKGALKPKSPSGLITYEQCTTWLMNPAIHPLTGRFVKIGSAEFNKFVKACDTHGIKIKEPQGSFSKIYGCNNDLDPVGQDDLSEFDEEKTRDIIKLGSGNCYALDSLYGWYKAKTQAGEETSDPMNPDYKLTPAEFSRIGLYMLANDPAYATPKKKSDKGAPEGYSLTIDEDWILYRGFHNVQIVHPDGTRRRIGSIPMTVLTGGIDSYVIWALMQQTWQRGLLMTFNDPAGTTGIDIFDQSRGGHNGSQDSVWWGGGDLPYGAYDQNGDMVNPIVVQNLAILFDKLNDKMGGI
jgi:hypothetical protein